MQELINIEKLSSRHIVIPWKMILASFPLLEVAKLEPVVKFSNKPAHVGPFILDLASVQL